MNGKTASYIFLALLAIVGLGSVYQIHGAADTMAKANADVAKAKADMAKRAPSAETEYPDSGFDPTYGQSTDAEETDLGSDTSAESGSGPE